MTDTITWKNFTLEDRKLLRKSYNQYWDEICNYKRFNPYRIHPHDFSPYMSPIENNVWHDIRVYGLPMLLQVPCGKYFIDFANPKLGIAIEADGKEWHGDREYEKERDEYLREMGYCDIYHITGRDTFDFRENEEIEPIDWEYIKRMALIYQEFNGFSYEEAKDIAIALEYPDLSSNSEIVVGRLARRYTRRQAYLSKKQHDEIFKESISIYDGHERAEKYMDNACIICERGKDQ
jgi:very-short-patch-repair endonuclease